MAKKPSRRSKREAPSKLETTAKKLEGNIHQLHGTIHKTEDITHALEAEMSQRGNDPRKRKTKGQA